MTAITSTTESTTESPADERFVEHPLVPGHIAIHDPAIVEDNGTYYVFGTHRRCARSIDLVHWERFENNLTRDPASLLGGIWEAWSKQPENPALEGSTWAPDVIWNDVMCKWCMYLSINGHKFRSVIVLLTADRLDGDWAYVGPVVYSGFNVDNVGRTDVPRVLGDKVVHGDLSWYALLKDTRINVIDAAPIRCDHGELWMSFGSWFGDIWMLKLDPKTGLRDYSVRYPLVHDSADPYYGMKVAGGYRSSGEGSYFVHRNGWWCLFVAYGWLGRTGGYRIRLFRSRNLVGPYVNQNGNPAISNDEIPDNQTKDTGIRFTSLVKWGGGSADDDTVEVSQGHDSVLTRGSDGRLFLTYHTRLIDRGDEGYETHVCELLPTADDWLTAAPYEYRGSAAIPPTTANTSDSTVGDDDDGLGDYIVVSSSAPNLAARPCHCVHPVHESDLAHLSLVSGDYEFVRHDPCAYFNDTRNADGTWHDVNLPEMITLRPDGRVTSGGVVGFFDTPDANLPRSTDDSVPRGSWRVLGTTPAGVHCCDSGMTITIDGMTYIGVFAVLPRGTNDWTTLTFSAIGGNRVIWGAHIGG